MKHNVYGIVVLLGIFLYSCKDIVEENIENKTVNILAPANGITSPDMTITFWWDEVEGATTYRLQVVKPAFASIQSLIVDSTLSKNKFTHTFQPGAYEWRIRAENGSSYTKYVIFSFSVDSSLNLSNQTVQLLSPANNTVSNVSKQDFKWQSIPIADDYRFEIVDAQGNVVFSNGSITSNTITYTFSSGGQYVWRVRAQNASSVSPYSLFNLTIDADAPDAPKLISPANGDTASAPVELKWQRDASVSADSVIIASDSLFKSPVVKELTASATYTFTTGTSGSTYFWKVKSRDPAANWGAFSSFWKFKVN